ncbi:MAG: hypothetical protein V7L23_27110 [Nostoc sp.]
MFVKSKSIPALAIRNRSYTGKTHLRGFKTLNFCLVRLRGLSLCSSELYETVGQFSLLFDPSPLKPWFGVPFPP